METLAWALFALVFVGPYLLAAAAACVAVFLVGSAAFKVSSRVGVSAIVLMSVAAGWIFYSYVLQGAAAFREACSGGTGVKVFSKARPDSYSLPSPAYAGGGYSSDDAARSAIEDVAFGRVPFIEIQDWPAHETLYSVPGELARFRPTSSHDGYFKIAVAQAPSPACRWLMPGDVGRLNYGSYLGYAVEYELNKRLQQQNPEIRNCIAVDYVAKPTAKYSVQFKSDQVSRQLFRYEVRVVDRSADQKLLSQAVAYHHKSESVWEAVGFRIGNYQGYDQCPRGLLSESRLLEQTLNIRWHRN